MHQAHVAAYLWALLSCVGKDDSLQDMGSKMKQECVAAGPCAAALATSVEGRTAAFLHSCFGQGFHTHAGGDDELSTSMTLR